MKEVKLSISPLHAQALGAHLILVLKNYLTGKKEGSIPQNTLALLEQMDQAYQKLSALQDGGDDETPRPVSFTLPEAEAFLKAFTEEEFQSAALQDDFYQRHSYPTYFAQIYSRYLEQLSERYVEALAA